MTHCYDTYLLNRNEEREDMADEIEEATEAARKRIHTELINDFFTCLQPGSFGELLTVSPSKDGVLVVGSTSAYAALCDVLADESVWKLLISTLDRPSPSIAAAFIAEAAMHYADTYADDLAEIEIERRRVGK